MKRAGPCASLLLVGAMLFAQSPAPAPPSPTSSPQSDKAAVAKALLEVQLADNFAGRIEEIIPRLPWFEQPVAWASLFAVWNDSGRLPELQKLRKDNNLAAFGLDQDLECSRIEHPWLRKALDGLASRKEQMAFRRQRLVSAAYVLRFLAPFGKGITSCVIVQMQSKIVRKNDYGESWPTLTPEERDIMRPIAADLGRIAEELATDDNSFDRAEQLAHTIIKLRSAAPLAGFLQRAGENNHIDERNDVIQEALDSITFDSDAQFTAELAGLLFPSLQQSTGYALDQHQQEYLATMQGVLKKAFDSNWTLVGPGAMMRQDTGNSVREKCALAAEAQRLSGFLSATSSKTVQSSVAACYLATMQKEPPRLGRELRTVADYLDAARLARDPEQRASYRLSAAKLALLDDPLTAVDIMNAASTEERLEYSGSWRQEQQNISVKAAKKLHEAGDSLHLAQLIDRLPDRLRTSILVGLAAETMSDKEELPFTEFMLKSAYRTLARFGTDDPAALVQFVNTFARALPVEAAAAFTDAMRWMNDVPHPADPWRDAVKARAERRANPALRDAPPPLGRGFKPAPLDPSVLQLPSLNVSAIDEVKDFPDRISLYLGLTRALLKQEKARLPASKPPTAAEQKQPDA